jgi:GAF domain-containing protein
MPQTWRDLLGELIETPSERERLANELGVHPWTPWRWIEDKTRPRAKYLKKIPDLFPKQKATLLQLLREDYPGLFPELEEKHEAEPQVQIPSIYYSRLLSALSSDPVFGSETIYHLGLIQLASQLVPLAETGVYIMSLSPSRRSLYTIADMTYDWKDMRVRPRYSVADHLLFAGRESTAGVAVASKQLAQTQTELAFPLLRRGKVAGCLWVISTAEEEWSQTKRNLLALYAELLAITFEESQCAAWVELAQFPDHSTQKHLLALYSKCSLSSHLIQELEDLILRQGGCP